MWVVIHHSKFYDWEPVPADVKLTDADKASGMCRPGVRDGTWQMRVTKTLDTHTDFHVDEPSLFHAMFHKDIRALRLTRRQALVMLLTKYAIPERFPDNTVTAVEVHDDGPDEPVFRALLATHLACGNIDQQGHDEHLGRYLESVPDGDHSAAHTAHLQAHFRIKPKSAARAVEGSK